MDMPPVTKIFDKEHLVETSKFEHANWSYEKFNPPQSAALEFCDKDNNFIAACLTSSGKTIMAECFLSYDIRVNKNKGIYLVPYKSLAQEKINEWTNQDHHFKDLKVSVCTSDYRLTADRKKELDAADLIILSYEMFNSRVRNIGSENSQFLLKSGTLVCDEFHSVGIPGRGDHIESALMKFTEINKDCRLVMLSATVPNVDELANWISFILNNKNTVLLKSSFRPCPLNLHYEKYWDGERFYDDNEQQKVNMALEIIKYYPDDKFLVFAHTKKTGELIKNALVNMGIKAEFHNANLDKSQRTKIEEKFKSNDDLRIVVATSTLAAGINMPARRVIILGVHRGLDEVEVFDIHQMCVSCDSRIMLYGEDKTYLAAKEIKIGDVVAGIKDNKLVGNKVLKIYEKEADVKRINLYNGTSIVASKHPFWTWDEKWVNSDNLCPGDKICIINKSHVNTYKTLKSIFYELVNNIDCYFRLVDSDQKDLLLKNNFELSKMLRIKRKSVSKFRKRLILKGDVAKELHVDLRFPRSKNGSEIDLENLDYDNLPWLLGILASDGNCRINRSCTKIRLYNKNQDILDKFKIVLNNCGLHVGVYKSKTTGKVSYECASHALVQIIDKLGITPRKTRTISVKRILEISDIEKANFIQGVLDGDGNYKNTIRICTASEKFAYELKEMFLSLGIRSTVSFEEGNGEVFGYPCDTSHYIVSVNNKNDMSKLLSKSSMGFKLRFPLEVIKNSRPVKGDLFYTKIKSVQNLGLQKVINFSVSGSNTFIVEDIPTHNCGRAGRPQYDPAGDAYILLPEKTYDLHKERIKKPQLILSQMLDQEGGHHKVLAFHLVSEIHQETIKTKDDIHHWYCRSLAHFQANELDDTIVDGVIDLLKKCGAVWEEDGIYTVTSIGKIASLFYYSPFDVSDLKRNFTQLFTDRKEDDDLYTAVALGNIDTHRFGIVSRAERDDMGMFSNTLNMKFGKGNIRESAIKAAYVYHQLLTGVTNPLFASMSRGLQFDFPRLNQVLQAIDGFTGGWNKMKWFRELQLRMNYGVKGPLLFLCELPNIGKVRANKLYKAGIKSLHDVVNNPDVLRKSTGLKKDKIEEILLEAKKLILTSP